MKTDEIREAAIRWLDETGTADMAANLFSEDECNDRLEQMTSSLAKLLADARAEERERVAKLLDDGGGSSWWEQDTRAGIIGWIRDGGSW